MYPVGTCGCGQAQMTGSDVGLSGALQFCSRESLGEGIVGIYLARLVIEATRVPTHHIHIG